TFTIPTNPVAADTPVTVTAGAAGASKSAVLTAKAPVVTSVTLAPASPTGGANSIATVTISGPAPAGGRLVSLASSNSAVAAVPASVTVAAGQSTAAVTVTTVPVTVNTAVTITA